MRLANFAQPMRFAPNKLPRNDAASSPSQTRCRAFPAKHELPDAIVLGGGWCRASSYLDVGAGCREFGNGPNPACVVTDRVTTASTNSTSSPAPRASGALAGRASWPPAPDAVVLDLGRRGRDAVRLARRAGGRRGRALGAAVVGTGRRRRPSCARPPTGTTASRPLRRARRSRAGAGCSRRRAARRVRDRGRGAAGRAAVGRGRRGRLAAAGLAEAAAALNAGPAPPSARSPRPRPSRSWRGNRPSVRLLPQAQS